MQMVTLSPQYVWGGGGQRGGAVAREAASASLTLQDHSDSYDATDERDFFFGHCIGDIGVFIELTIDVSS